MPDNLPALHSVLGASSMYRWSVCPGSIRMSRGIKAPTSQYAEEGTKAHEVATHVLEEGKFPPDTDPDVKEAVSVYTDTVKHQIDESIALFQDTKYSQLIEHKFDLSSVYPGCYGTADCVLYFPNQKTLYVFDYKHGMGIPVEVTDNPQLKYYGLGALLSTGVPCEFVELVIVQPRCPHPDGPVRRERIPAFDLLDFSADLIDYAKATEDPNAPLVPGDHCRFCPAAGICPALAAKAQVLAKSSFSSLATYDPEKLSEVLEWLPSIEGWVKSVREFAYAESQHGRTPPGWKLVPKRATRRWKDHVNAELLKEKLGLDDDGLLEEPKLKSPAQVEKRLAPAGKKIVADLVTAESSGTSLVPEADRRAAVTFDPKSAFDEIKEVVEIEY